MITFELWAQQWAKVVFKTAENTLWQHEMRAGWSYDAIEETKSNRQASEFDSSDSRPWSDFLYKDLKVKDM